MMLKFWTLEALDSDLEPFGKLNSVHSIDCFELLDGLSE